jgi:hypothetical protein
MQLQQVQAAQTLFGTPGSMAQAFVSAVRSPASETVCAMDIVATWLVFKTL